MISEITCVQDIVDLAMLPGARWKNYGEVAVDETGDFLLFNYTPKAVYENRWNFFEQVSRGLVIDKREGAVAARAFDKFWNWGEGGRLTRAPIRTVSEKCDGSLGILYRDNGRYRITTRGCFTSTQAIWATKFLNDHYDLSDLHPDVTLIFEIIYPENRFAGGTVVDYGDMEALVLLAARNFRNGEFLKNAGVQSLANYYNFPTPKVYEFSAIDEIVQFTETLDANHEGFVVEFEDGQRFKFKGSAYLELARLVSNLSYKRVLEAVRNNSLETIRASLPEELRATVDEWVGEIEAHIGRVEQTVNDAYSRAPIGVSGRAAYAYWVKHSYPDLAPYLFAKYDGKDLRPIILKLENFEAFGGNHA